MSSNKRTVCRERSTVTTEVALPGRLLVLVPNANYIGISKKIWDKFDEED